MRRAKVFALCLFGILPAILPAQTRTVGLITHDEKRASPGYTLLYPKHYGRTYLIDNFGQVINTWDSKYEPGQSAYLSPEGHLFRTCNLPASGSLGTGGGEGGRIEEYDWDGNLVWSFEYVSSTYAIHHDFKVLPNGNIIALLVERKSQQEALAAGVNPAMMLDTFMLPDAVVEIQPVRPSGGKIVWEWHVWDHLIQKFDSTKANYGDAAAHPERVDPNASPRKFPAFWNHMNSIDYNAAFDQILLSVRGNSEVWVIDHSTTTAEAASHAGGKSGKGGDLIYRWGNPQMYYAGKQADQMLYEQHDAQWIQPGRTGAGNMLIFNNGVNRPGGNASSSDEIAVPVDTSGKYTLAASGAFGPTQLAWTYAGLKGASWYESDISGSYRLANGNTLMCYGTHGVLVEVTAAGEIVWQYVNPVVNTGPVYQGDSSGLDDRGHNWNAVFKAQRYAPDYAAFTGRTLSQKGTIELSGTRYVNGASFQSGNTSAGAVLTVMSDTTLSDGTAAAPSATLPAKLAGTAVDVADASGVTLLASLYYVSPRQINLVVPERSARGAATVTIRRDSGSSTSGKVTIDPVGPGLFTMGSTTIGAITALRVTAAGQRTELPVFQYNNGKTPDYVTVAIDLGAASDQVYLSLYGTGIRGYSSPPAVTATIGGVALPVAGAAAHGQYAGLDQVNLGPLPRGLAGKGESGLVLKVDDKTANTVMVNIR